MPVLNGTGPMGQGPKTGRGMGNCEGAVPAAGYGFGFGRGYGCGCGRGMGRRGVGFGWSDAITPAEEKAYLEAQKDTIEKRLNELKKS